MAPDPPHTGSTSAAFICDSFGRDAWLKIIKQAHVDCNWVSSCPYPDKVTYDLVITGAGILGVTVPQALEAYGQYFVNYVIQQGYTRLLRSLGANIAEWVVTGEEGAKFLANLNNLHLHLTMGFPSMVAPAFRVEQVTSTSLLLHYHSIRPALWPIVSGVLKGISKVLFDFEVELQLVASREQGDCDHEIFRVSYPHQESLADWDDHGAALASSYAMTSDFFYDMFPFHVILDRDCRVVQCGRVMGRLFGDTTLTRGSLVSDTFKLRHPYIPFEYERMVLESDSLFLLKSLEKGLEFKGQMVQTSMPDGLPVLLFLGSPRVANLEEMTCHGIYLSDIPLHDMSRDFVLLAEQRQAEADLKERFEKMAVELRVANSRLEQATRWLDEEKQRSDALLYRMLPADIAVDLREGRKVEPISYPEVTILFSDMVGFTNTSAKSTPEEVYNMLNIMYDKFDRLVDDFPDVYKLETIGDAYFLVCNLTTECEKHVDTAIDFAIRMQAAAREVKNAQGEPVQIRIGIHTGPVVGGVLGAKTPRFSIYGDTVNVASRMESHGLPGKIHISEAAYLRIVEKEKYAVRERGNIAVKGRGNMTTYLIGGTADDWLLRNSSFDTQMDGGSGNLRDGSFVVTASARSGESLAPRTTGGMEAIKEGDEGRAFRTNPAGSASHVPASSNTSSSIMNNNNNNNNNNSANQLCSNREGSGRHGGAGAVLAPARASGAGALASGGGGGGGGSGHAIQILSAARGSTENNPIATGAGGSDSNLDAFISPQAAAAAAAAAATAATAASSVAGGGVGSAQPSFTSLHAGGSLREGLPPSVPSGGLLRDTSFRAVYARGRGAVNPGSPLVSTNRSALSMAASLTNLATAGASIAGSVGGGDAEQIPSSGSYASLADVHGRGGGGGVNSSPHAGLQHQTYEPSPLSRIEPSGGSGVARVGGPHLAGMVLARSATAKASSSLAPASRSQSGMSRPPTPPASATAIVMASAAMPPAAAAAAAAPPPPPPSGGANSGRTQQQVLQGEQRDVPSAAPTLAPPGSARESEMGATSSSPIGGGGGDAASPKATSVSSSTAAAAAAAAPSKPKGFAKKLKSLFRK
ncbi:hypothetical protein PLESTB_000607500 [Pleodorina starrii]|uniref:guanylate cyclase n=1 Tax=Pleodorina starrii TaxID=330485 RepID=A0A9W6BHN1_9CHLO|nr:hypothetical protein PLESTB_000607500 [Pleodorina starrii]